MVKMPSPTDVKQLRAFIGMVQYYARFIPNLSHRLHPLLELQVKGKKWSWGKRQEEAFKDVKEELQSVDPLQSGLTIVCGVRQFCLWDWCDVVPHDAIWK